MCLNNNSNIIFEENSKTLFKNNMATIDGGGINIFTNSSLMVKDCTVITFTTNSAQYGGAICFDATHNILVFNKS